MANKKTHTVNSNVIDIASPEEKENFSVVIVDSGMGGLSIGAEIARRLAKGCAFDKVSITYFNAWPDQDRGYNLLPDDSERIRVFDNALAATLNFTPNIILIACNTLSVLYRSTLFSRQTNIPVVGIVDYGVEMIHAYLASDPRRQTIIMGTLTTIAANSHRIMLATKGIAADRMVAQPCNQLATQIENNPKGPVVRGMIDEFISQAVNKLTDRKAPVAASLCCTHFGYSADLIQASLTSKIDGNITILNPNTAMAERFVTAFAPPRSGSTTVDISVVSKIVWHREKLQAMASVLETVSPEVANALLAYHHDPELFIV